MTARFGARTALGVGFLFSGIVHELVISLPAQGGWGGPTVFFLLQAAAMFVETRSEHPERWSYGAGLALISASIIA